MSPAVPQAEAAAVAETPKAAAAGNVAAVPEKIVAAPAPARVAAEMLAAAPHLNQSVKSRVVVGAEEKTISAQPTVNRLPKNKHRARALQDQQQQRKCWRRHVTLFC